MSGHRALRRYRLSLGTLIVCYVSAPVILFCILLVWADNSPSWVLLAAWLVVVYAFLATGRRAKVLVYEDELVVRNLIWSYRLPWPGVQEFVPSKEVHVMLPGGARVKLWAVQRANASGILGRRSRVDDVAEELNEYRRRLTTGQSSTAIVRRALAPMSTASEWIEIGAVLAALVVLGVYPMY